MNDAEHKELVKLAEEGKILIGVDRTVARQLFTDVSLSTIQQMTGEVPYLEKTLAMSAHRYSHLQPLIYSFSNYYEQKTPIFIQKRGFEFPIKSPSLIP